MVPGDGPGSGPASGRFSGCSGRCSWRLLLSVTSQVPAVFARADVVHEGQVILAFVLAINHDELAAEAGGDALAGLHAAHGVEHVLGKVDAAAAVVIRGCDGFDLGV